MNDSLAHASDDNRSPKRRRRASRLFSSRAQAVASMTPCKFRRCERRSTRCGLAVTELAVCLPVVVLLVLAMIEACTMIFLKQSLT
ncbi:MAG: TadE/TadG family type IV pilus assembly protein, partial [Planctomycetota bacterium]